MHQLLRLSRWIDSLNEQIGRLTYWLALLMVGVGTWNVAGRYVGRAVGQNLSSNALIEIQWYIFDLLFLLGGAYALNHDEHVRMDVVQHRFSVKYRALADFIGTILFLIPFCVVVIIYAWNPVINSWRILEMSSDPNGLPRYPIKAMILVSFFLLILQGISEAIKKFAIFQGILQPVQERHESEL